MAKPQHAQGMFAEARLGLIDDILITAGWRPFKDGWLPPEKYRRAIEIGHGRGHWCRAYAIAFMTQADEATAAFIPN
jgi:hypothetical protein